MTLGVETVGVGIDTLEQQSINLKGTNHDYKL
jgi:hypothetical protein